VGDETETHADWACGNCDEFQQLFLERDAQGVWAITAESQEMIQFHMNGRCSD
jgi:hypothetical protein